VGVVVREGLAVGLVAVDGGRDLVLPHVQQLRGGVGQVGQGLGAGGVGVGLHGLLHLETGQGQQTQDRHDDGQHEP
jgi:hypothetical protein